jgi:Retroviral aspartyl protease
MKFGNFESYVRQSRYVFNNHGLNDNRDKYILFDVRIMCDRSTEHIVGEAFVDSGCTFNAISEEFARKCGVPIESLPNDLILTVGGGKIINIQRRIAKMNFELPLKKCYGTYVFVMDPIPIGADILFGMEFLNALNPTIDWRTKSLTFQDQHKGEEEQEIGHIQQIYLHTEVPHQSDSGDTLIIDFDEYLKDMELSNGDSYFFVLNQQSDKVARFLNQNWESLKDNPAYSILIKYKDTVFKEKLQIDVQKIEASLQHEIDITDRTAFLQNNKVPLKNG